LQSNSGRDLESEDSRFFQFYNEKVLELQKKAGDDDHCPISGNLYMYRALANFGDTSGLFQEKASPLAMCGLMIVVVVQILGPLAILFWACHNIEFFPNGKTFGVTESMGYKTGSNHHGLSHLLQRLLGVLFLLLFSANGLYVVRQDKRCTRKVTNMCKVFKRAAAVSRYDPPQERWLYFGAICNGLCLVMCSFCMCFLFVLAEDGPKDVLFDAFGLTFLYNLDDVSGDLAFLDEKWDEDQMGDIYGMLADELDIMKDIDEERESTFTPDNIYTIFEVLVAILIVVLPLVHLFVEMRPKEG